MFIRKPGRGIAALFASTIITALLAQTPHTADATSPAPFPTPHYAWWSRWADNVAPLSYNQALNEPQRYSGTVVVWTCRVAVHYGYTYFKGDHNDEVMCWWYPSSQYVDANTPLMLSIPPSLKEPAFKPNDDVKVQATIDRTWSGTTNANTPVTFPGVKVRQMVVINDEHMDDLPTAFDLCNAMQLDVDLERCNYPTRFTIDANPVRSGQEVNWMVLYRNKYGEPHVRLTLQYNRGTSSIDDVTLCSKTVPLDPTKNSIAMYSLGLTFKAFGCHFPLKRGEYVLNAEMPDGDYQGDRGGYSFIVR